MREIRRIEDDATLRSFAALTAEAYPGTRAWAPEDLERVVDRMRRTDAEPTVDFYGLFDGGELRGGMRLHDFVVNVRGAQVPACGVGGVAVDLLHKKEHVAKDLVLWYLRRTREQGRPLATLYPFRPDFYAKMGFGYGPKMHHHKFAPSALPDGSREGVRRLGPDDAGAVLACYDRAQNRTHGLFARSPGEVSRLLLDNPAVRVVGVVQGRDVLGYLAFRFEPIRAGNVLRNDLYVTEMVAEDRDVLLRLLAFLRSQADQADHVMIDTHDPDWHWLLADPRNGSTDYVASLYQPVAVEALGVMYRWVDVRAGVDAMADARFGPGRLRIGLAVRDGFLMENEASVTVDVRDGRMRRTDEPADVTVRVDVAGFSSLCMGTASLRSLHRYGLADVTDVAAVDELDAIFAVPKPPVCLTFF